MIGGMLGEAPVADEICRQPIVARVSAARQDGKRCHGKYSRFHFAFMCGSSYISSAIEALRTAV